MLLYSPGIVSLVFIISILSMSAEFQECFVSSMVLSKVCVWSALMPKVLPTSGANAEPAALNKRQENSVHPFLL